MPRYKFFWPSGTHIRLVRMGCTNRPFYHIGVIPKHKRIGRVPHEVIGSYDPMPNERNEKLVSIDLNRLTHWLGKGAEPSIGVAKLLGILGVTDPFPETVMHAWKTRTQTSQPDPSDEIKKEQAAV